ncbi:MAG: hypothetical protein ACOVO3_10215 [Fluviicola sp.]
MATNESIYKQHEENTEWLKKLDFYKDEISILKGRLEELATKNNAQEVLAEVERFQNQFIIQRNNIDEIAHKVREHEQSLLEEIKSNPVAVDHRKVEYHAVEQDLVNSFEKVFNEVREDFNKFSAKWM